MFDGMMRSALAAAGMTPEDVQEKVEDIVTSCQRIAAASERIERRLVRLEKQAGLEPLDFSEQEEENENVRYINGD